MWFSILERKAVRRGDLSLVVDLEAKISRFIDVLNTSLAKPFSWTYEGEPLAARPAKRSRDFQSGALETRYPMKIHYSTRTTTSLFTAFTKGGIVRGESVGWNVTIGHTATCSSEITILDATKSGMYPLQIERVVAYAA